jgi:hypothetical protein
MTADSPSDHDSVSVETVERRTRTLEKYARTGATVLVAHIGFLAIVIPILTFLGSVEALTAQDLQNRGSFFWGLSFWLMVVGGCLYIMFHCRRLAARTKRLLDAHDNQDSLPSIERFENEFNTGTIAIQMTVVETATVGTFLYLILATIFDESFLLWVFVFGMFIVAGVGIVFFIGEGVRGIQFVYRKSPRLIGALGEQLLSSLQRASEKLPTDRFSSRDE